MDITLDKLEYWENIVMPQCKLTEKQKELFLNGTFNAIIEVRGFYYPEDEWQDPKDPKVM
jgi:hypothetical protein